MSISKISALDLEFVRAFECGEVSVSEFNHLAHLRLAYVYLCRGGLESAEEQMRNSLLAFLGANKIPREKFHETLTRAWLMAVLHFMRRRDSCDFADFISGSESLLDTEVMLTHYSAAELFSESARGVFVEPDLEAIPC